MPWERDPHFMHRRHAYTVLGTRSWGTVSRQGTLTAAIADKERRQAEKILVEKLTQITEHLFNKCQKWMPKYSEYYVFTQLQVFSNPFLYKIYQL